MGRRVTPADARTLRRRRADGMRRLRARRRNGIEQFTIDVRPQEKVLATKFAGLAEGTTDKAAIAAAIGRLLRLGLIALLEKGTLDAKAK